MLLLTVTSHVLLPCGGVKNCACWSCVLDVQCFGDFMGRSLKDMDAFTSFALKPSQWLDYDSFLFPFGLQ